MRRSVAIPMLVLTLLLTALVTPVAASGSASDRAIQQFEIRFMEKTIEHHLMGVEMGEMCLERATAPPPASDETLVELCSQIIAVQSGQAELLMAWLDEWYGVDFQPKLSDGMMNRLERASGEEFDIMVSEMFIDHHLRQIRMSDDCLMRAEHGELLSLCQQMIASQAAEIGTFRGILADHGVDH